MDDTRDLIPTRRSLLGRLKDWNDHESWQVFFDTYWRLIYETAVKAGLNDAEAQDVVQETILAVCKKLPGFEYDPSKGTFKAWLRTLTGWRILAQLRRRGPVTGVAAAERVPPTDVEGPSVLEGLADPACPALEALWDGEWEKNLLAAALERLKKKVRPKEYQVYDYYVTQQLPVSQVARALQVSRGRVYLIKHRMNKLIKKEIANLSTKLL
jgi:RNA polymerase sigma-70 factor (ECF subfamily)